jgi:ABC transporter DrrB family efflux protein
MRPESGSRVGGPLYGFASIARKEVLHLRRDPASLFFALVLPLFQLVLFGYAVNFDVRHIAAGVVDLDRSRESRAYVDRLRNTQYLDFTRSFASPGEAEEALRRGTARVAVIIPPDFSRHVRPGDTPIVRVLIDGSDSQVATPARQAFMSPPGQSATATQSGPGDPPANVEPRITMMFNPEIRSQVYMIPGLIGLILQIVTVSLTSFSLVREREQGTMEQLMVSPVGRLGLMLGKLAPFAALAFIEMAAILLVGWLVFDVPVQGSPFLLMALSIPFILAALSLGLLISTIAQTQGQALQFTMLLTLPSTLLSGFVFPRDTMPGFLYLLSSALPVTYFLDILRGIVVRGATLPDLLPALFGLCVITVVILAAATLRFRKSMA